MTNNFSNCRLFVILVGLGVGVSGCGGLKENASPLGPPGQHIPFRPENEILAEDLSFDLAAGEIHYNLPEPALVRLRIGRAAGGALLRTMIDWERREKGPHVEVWDKKDASGKVDFSGINDVAAVLACRPVDGRGAPIALRGLGKSPDFEIIFVTAQERDETGTVIVSGKTPVRIVVADRDIAWLREGGYEIVLYVDQVFLIEGEKGISPFNYLLNVEGFNEGYHYLIVNVASFSGEVGTKTAKFYVKKGG